MNVNDDYRTCTTKFNRLAQKFSHISTLKYRLAKKCKVYSKLILRKIVEIVAIRCELKFAKFDCGKCFAPDPAGGAYSVPPAGFKGIYF